MDALVAKSIAMPTRQNRNRINIARSPHVPMNDNRFIQREMFVDP